MAYQHPLFERFSPDMAKMIVPPLSSRALIGGQTKAQLPFRPTASNIDPFVTNSGIKAESRRGGMGPNKVLSQNKKLTPPPMPSTKQERKLPPSVVIASLRWGETRPFSHDEPDAPPSVRIAALRRDDPTEVLDHIEPRPPQLVSGPARATKAHEMVSNRIAKGKEAQSGVPGFSGCHPIDITDVDVPESSVSHGYAALGYGHVAETPKTREDPIEAAKPSETIRSSHDETRLQLVTPASLVVASNAFSPNNDNGFRQRLAEEERFLQAMIAERKINRAAAEATRAVYQIANPSRRPSALEQFAFAEQERAFKRQRIILDRELALQTQKQQERRRPAERSVVGDEETARRQRLAAALYGSGKPKPTKPKHVLTPKKREPEAASRTQHSAETHRKREPDAVTFTQREAIPASPATLHRRSAYATQAHIDPLLYFQQHQLQQQQTLALNGLLAFPSSSFSPGQTVPLYPDDGLEQLLLLQRLSRR